MPFGFRGVIRGTGSPVAVWYFRTGAIVFGNLKDPNSAVNKTKDNPRDYRLFDYIGVNARVSYLARVMNPNPKMPDVPKDGVVHKQGGHA